MTALLRLARLVDRVNAVVGRGASWLALAMVLVGAYNAVVRYLGRFVGWNLSSNVYIELQWYLFSVLFLLAAAWALREDDHVRVDVILSRLAPRTRVWIDLAGHTLFLIPFALLTLWLSWPSVRSSWAVGETSPDPGGLPRYPLKTIILVCFVLLALQALSEIVKDVARLRGELPLEEGRSREREREEKV